jgi:twitching motility protein PilT
VTVEDPIEFLHKDKKSFITQREVDVDTRSLPKPCAVLASGPGRYSRRRNARSGNDRNRARRGGNRASRFLDPAYARRFGNSDARIISAFPPYQQKSIRIQLAGLLKAVVSQRLMKSAKGTSRVPAVEVLISTPLIRDYILHEDKTTQIRDAISAGTSQYGMQTFDQSLFYLYQSGLITLEEALRGSTNPDEFRLRLAGIQNTSTMAKEEMERHSNVGKVSDLISRI